MDAPDAQASLPGLQSPGTRGAAAIFRRVVGGEREDRPGTAGRLGESSRQRLEINGDVMKM